MLRMRSLSLLLVSLLFSTVAFAQEPMRLRLAGARHVILDPQHVLSDVERAELRADGIVVGRAMPNGRYIARVAEGATAEGHELMIRSLEPITAERKLSPNVIHAAVSGRPYVRMSVIFNDEVSFDDARNAVLAAGGELERPFSTDFGIAHNLAVRVPATAVQQLAADELVYTIQGPRPRIANDNAVAAQTARVDVVQASPYGLNGSGVVLSYFELSPADPTHVEFQGRLTTHFPANASTTDQLHATHTAGTMIAAGINPSAKGMAPAATLHGYDACDDCNWLSDKQTQLPIVKAIADNNSWGYILGWCDDSRCTAPTGWLWTENQEYIGGYDTETDGAIDKITRTGQTLFVHSAGNDGTNSGPSSAPFAHNHVDNNGNTIKGETFCYSSDGSGTDCPVPQCSAGAVHCEITHHPTNTTVTSVGLTASSKNIITVGATDSGRNVVSFSSRGPTLDGRVKPDITAKGFNTLSTTPGNQYAKESGTSMASPVVTGIAALLTQQWRQTFNTSGTPNPAQLKALLIAGAVDEGNPGPDYTNGFGAVDAKNSVDLIIADGGAGRRIVTNTLAQGSQLDVPLALASAGDLRAVLVWTDTEAAPLSDDTSGPTLVNDLDLSVSDPNGAQVLPYVLDKNNPFANATRGVNKVDNVEEVEIKGAAAGTYHLIVKGTRVISNSPQQFALVATNGTIGNAAPVCTDPTEPNDTPAQAFGLGSGQSVSPRICSASDVDVFRFHLDKQGVLTFTINSSDTPLHTVLTGTGIGAPAVDIPSGAAVPVSQALNPGDYFLQISPSGAVGATGNYTLSVTFPAVVPARGRAARH